MLSMDHGVLLAHASSVHEDGRTNCCKQPDKTFHPAFPPADRLTLLVAGGEYA